MAGDFPAWPLVVDGALLLTAGGYALAAGLWVGGVLSALGLTSASVGMLDRRDRDAGSRPG